MSNTNAIMLNRMAQAGVSLADAHWYHTVARQRGFSGPGDRTRAQAILRKVEAGCPGAKHKMH